MVRDCSIDDLEALVNDTLDGETAAAVGQHAAACASCRDELAWLRAESELMARRRQTQAASTPALWDGIATRIAAPPIVTSALDGSAPVTPLSAQPSASMSAATLPAASSSTLSLSLPSPRRWHWGARVAYGGLLAAAAAALLFVGWPRAPSEKLASSLRDAAAAPASLRLARKKLAPDVALSNAEVEYKDALSVLEAQYQAERGRLPPTVAKRYDSMLAQTRTRVADARLSAGNDVEGRIIVLDGYAEYMRSLQKIVSDIR